MKLILLFSILLLTACSHNLPVSPMQVRAKLIKDTFLSHNKYMLTLISNEQDTIHVRYGVQGFGRKKKFYAGDWYIIQFDSAKCNCPTGAVKWIKASIKRMS